MIFRRILISLEIARNLGSQTLADFIAGKLSTFNVYDGNYRNREYIEDEDLVDMEGYSQGRVDSLESTQSIGTPK